MIVAIEVAASESIPRYVYPGCRLLWSPHEHHGRSIKLVLRHKKETACTAAHCLAEVYAVVTGMPGKDRASPDEALLFCGDIRERRTIVTPDGADYADVIVGASALRILGEVSTMHSSRAALEKHAPSRFIPGT